ncbi:MULTISPECIES: metallophosphoesterase [Kitasatospora]|uniref:metallophosphoesterase n=1 Tax=Kitasatospora TaxID=2063 RepID=UPI0003191123|nr:metallophosphoesterase [Kitasatospora setae]
MDEALGINTVTVVATGCFHSAVPDSTGMLAEVRALREQGALVVDVGDFFGGSAFHEYSRGRTEERLLADLYDAVVPGNHDLVDLMRLHEPERFPPVVCTNLTPPPAFAGRWERGLLLEAAGRRIGVVGVLGVQAFGAVPAAERDGFVFEEPTPALLTAERDRLLEAGADVVVGLSHSGFEADVALQLAGGPLEIVVAGHCHSPTGHWAIPPRYVVKPPECGTGVLRIELGPAEPSFGIEYTGGREAPRGLVPPYVREAVGAFRAWGSTAIGHLAAPVHDRHRLAELVAERGRRAAGADAFVLNLATLRTGLPRHVDRQALVAAAPFDTALVVLDGPRTAEQVAALAEARGESPVTAGTTIRPGTVATTAYLAERLGLPARALDSPRTLRGLLTDHVKEAS